MTSTDTPTVMMDKLAEAAWAQLADMSPRALHIDGIAAAAGVAPSAARAVSGSITALILHQLARLDRQAILLSDDPSDRLRRFSRALDDLEAVLKFREA